jgi:hypothetical protein
LSVIFYEAANVPGGGKPEAINLTATPQEVFNYVQELESLMETLSGINSVSRGNPPPSLSSGVALALVQSMAIDFASSEMNNYVRLLESVGTATIELLKVYANTERVAQIVGKNNRSYMKSFTGDSLKEVNRVTVTVGNPLSSTTAGRISITEQLLQAGLITSPEQYLEVLNTGSLESAIEGETAELMLVRSENEKLTEGDPNVTALATDDHALHLREHKVVLASPSVRHDGAVVEAVLAHMQEHINLLTSTDPNLLQAIGQQPLGQSPQGPGQQGQADVGPAMVDELGQGEVNGVPLPGMPNNPLTGNQFDPDTGGL